MSQAMTSSADRLESAMTPADMLAPGHAELVGRELKEGWQLPAALYSDPAYFAIETERIFDRSWSYVCREEDLESTGDYVTTTLGSLPVVVVRDRSGALRAHVNVCLHRLHPVAEGRGCKKILQCSYHGWSYDLDGRLKGAPESQHEADFDRSGMRLRSVSVGVLGGLVFANPDPGTLPLHEYAAEGVELVDRLRVRLDGWTPTGTFSYDIAANWKLFMENSLECYHCGLVHRKSFGSVISTQFGSYTCENYDHVAAQRAPVLEPPTHERRSPKAMDGFRLLYLWPFTAVSVDDYTAVVGRVVPTGPKSCRLVADTFMNPLVTDQGIIDEWLEMYNRTFSEDKVVVTAQQVGYDTGRVERGRLMPSSESTILMFQRGVWRALTERTPD